MFYNYYRDEGSEYNECTARGACSITPKMSSLQEVLIIFLRQISFYALMLNKMEEDISQISDMVVESLAGLISTTDYTDEQLLGLVGKQYALLVKTKRQYLQMCKNKDISCKEIKFGLEVTPQTTLTEIISQGEKLVIDKFNQMSASQRNLYEILLAVIKSVCANIISLKDNNNQNDENAKTVVLKGLDLLNHSKFSESRVKSKIKELVKADENLLKEIGDFQRKIFGQIKEVKVSHSTEIGKAILVAGGGLSELYHLLEATENKEVDVYTHGDLLIAHAFENFSKFKNLKGHYGSCSEKCILDFATFPGAILLTRNSSQNIEYLYRGRLFTTEKFKPQGVVQIVNNDFRKVIKSALEAKGFAKGQKRDFENVGFDTEILKGELNRIFEKFTNNEIEKLVIIGIANHSRQQENYFKTLSRHLPEKTLVISFSYNLDYKDTLTINVGNNVAIVYEILTYLFGMIPKSSDRVSIFVTKCDAGSISKIIALKENGAKNVYLSNCAPNVINPSVQATLEDAYGIKTTADPEHDAKKL